MALSEDQEKNGRSSWSSSVESLLGKQKREDNLIWLSNYRSYKNYTPRGKSIFSKCGFFWLDTLEKEYIVQHSNSYFAVIFVCPLKAI